MARKKGRDEGKAKFLRDFLQKDPNASAKAVNDAWTSAGNKGTISGSYFYTTKAKLGLSGRQGLPKTASPNFKRKPGRPPRAEGAMAAHGPSGSRQERRREIEELEVEIDKLMNQVMNLGGLDDVEGDLRRARRSLWRASQT